MPRQIHHIRGRIEIIAGTPGRLIDLLTKYDIDLACVSVLVIDEVDCMLQKGFCEQGISTGFLNGLIQVWALHLKGPVYVAMFKPLSIVVALVMGVIFLSDSLHLGSVVGGMIISLGFYAVLWGKAREDCNIHHKEGLSSSSTLQHSSQGRILHG